MHPEINLKPALKIAGTPTSKGAHTKQRVSTSKGVQEQPIELILIAKVTKCIFFQERVSLVYYWVLILIINMCAPNHIVKYVRAKLRRRLYA